jgi:dihydrofolate reductase
MRPRDRRLHRHHAIINVMKSISLVYAVSENGVIGKDNKLPWHLPAEQAHFKALTMGHTVIMGRRTYQSIGRPLPGRQNIVLSHNLDYTAQGVEVAYSLEDAVAKATDESIFVAGGAGLYTSALAIAQRVHETLVHATVVGDTFFNPDLSHWLEEEREEHKADAKNQYDYTFITYVKP